MSVNLAIWGDNWQFGVINCSLVIFGGEIDRRAEYASSGTRGGAEAEVRARHTRLRLNTVTG